MNSRCSAVREEAASGQVKLEVLDDPRNARSVLECAGRAGAATALLQGRM
jgi:hypothetical protein